MQVSAPVGSRSSPLGTCPVLYAGQRPMICMGLPGGSGNGCPILAHSARQGISVFPHASRVACSELLGGPVESLVRGLPN